MIKKREVLIDLKKKKSLDRYSLRMTHSNLHSNVLDIYNFESYS